MTADLKTMLGRLAAAGWRAVQEILLVLVPVASMITPSSGAEQIYFFADDRGVPHFSNVPADPRYRPMEELSIGRAERPVERSPDEDTRVLTWPALGEQVNEMSEEGANGDAQASAKLNGVRPQ